MHFCRALFIVEVLVNAVSGPAMVLAPALTLGPLLGGEHRVSEEAAEVGRWFGCMIFAFGSVLLGRALRGDTAEVLRPILCAFLVGDVCYTLCAARWAHRSGLWTPAAVFNVGFSVALLLARVAAVRDIRCALNDDGRGEKAA